MELVVINSTNITAMTSFANNANGSCVRMCVSSTPLEGPCRNYRINAPCIAFNIYSITNGFELHAIHSHSPQNPYTQTHMPTKRVKASANDHICCGSQNSKLLILKSN